MCLVAEGGVKVVCVLLLGVMFPPALGAVPVPLAVPEETTAIFTEQLGLVHFKSNVVTHSLGGNVLKIKLNYINMINNSAKTSYHS